MLENESIVKSISLHLIVILLVIINIANIKIPGVSHLIPLFDLMAIFYFTIFKNIFSIWFVFLLGIWGDSLSGSPLGLTSICYILLGKFFLTINSKMFIRENFQQIWKQFIIFCFLFLLMKWTILSIFNGYPHSIISPITQLILSSILYVIMHRFFDYLTNRLIEN